MVSRWRREGEAGASNVHRAVMRSLEIWCDTIVINGKSGRWFRVGGFRKGRDWGQSCECKTG